MKRVINSNTTINSPMFTVIWYRYPNGREGEPMHMQYKEFADIDIAVKFLITKSQRTRGIYWAGGQIEDSDGDVVYEITSDYEHFDNLGIVEEKSYER